MGSKGGRLAQLCATPLEIERDGKTWRLRPLTLGQYAAMEQWARQQPFRELEGKLAAIGDKKLREAAREKLLERAITQSESEQYVSETLDGGAAVEKLFGLMLRADRPETTDEEIQALLDAEGLNQVRAWVESLVGAGEEARKNPPATAGG